MKSLLLLASASIAIAGAQNAHAQTADTQNAPSDQSKQRQRDRSASSQPHARQSREAPEQDGDVGIVVTGIRGSLETAQEIKRHSDSILDAVAAEDINQLPDNSATEALARLPGTQVLRFRGEAQGITVRGLSQVLTTINGQDLFYGTSRQSLLNSYPASLIATAQIYKALTPDLIEGGIGGGINIDLRKPLDFRRGLTIAGTVRGTYDDEVQKAYYNGDLLVNQRWETGIGEIGLLVNASYLRRDYLESYRQNQLPTATTVAPTDNPALGTGLLIPGGILIRHSEGFYRRPVVTAAAQWRPQPGLDFDLRVTHVTDKNEYWDNYLTTSIAANTKLTNVELELGTNVVKSATFLASGAYAPYSSDTKLNIDTTQVDFGARYETGIATLSTRAVYTRSRADTYVRALRMQFVTAPTINADFQSDSKYGGLAYQYVGVDMTDPSNFIANAYVDQHDQAVGDEWQWRSDMTLDTAGQFFRELKFGTRYTDRSARFQSGSRSASLGAYKLHYADLPGGDQAGLVNAGFHGDDADIPSTWISYDGQSLGDDGNYAAFSKFIGTLPGLASAFSTDLPAFDPLKAFDASERTYAFYGQFKYGLDLFGFPIDGVARARGQHRAPHQRHADAHRANPRIAGEHRHL